MTAVEYTNKVHEMLESFGYPELVEEFDPVDVACSMVHAIATFYQSGFSYRMCAITIWQATLVYQVMPSMDERIKH